MLTIYKYPIPTQDWFDLELPDGAYMLTAQQHQGELFLWAMVDTHAPLRKVTFRLYGTGRPVNPDVVERLRHVATIQNGPFVWHLFRECPVLDHVSSSPSLGG